MQYHGIIERDTRLLDVRLVFRSSMLALQVPPRPRSVEQCLIEKSDNHNVHQNYMSQSATSAIPATKR